MVRASYKENITLVSVVLKKKYSGHLLKMVRQTLFKGAVIMEFCSRGVRWSATPNTPRKSDELYPRSRVGIGGCKVTKKTTGVGGCWLTGVLQQVGQGNKIPENREGG